MSGVDKRGTLEIVTVGDMPPLGRVMPERVAIIIELLDSRQKVWVGVMALAMELGVSTSTIEKVTCHPALKAYKMRHASFAHHNGIVWGRPAALKEYKAMLDKGKGKQ